MRRIVVIITAVILASQAFWGAAQRSQQKLTDQDRQKWLVEMRNQKHDFLAQELALTRDQQNAFFPLYDEMEDELTRINAEVRDLERKVINNPKASDTEIESAARTIFEQKQREGAVEMTYFNKFKTILKPRQLLKLKDAERQFTRQLVKQHKRISTQ